MLLAGAGGCLSGGGADAAPRHQRSDLNRPFTLAYDGRPELVHVLPVVRPRHPFHECLFSWNVETTPEAGLRFELRVGRGTDGWSPWLYLGDWNAPRSPEAVTEFESGRIDVDYFTSEVYWERVQVRVTARFTDEALRGAQARVERMNLCFTDRYALPELVTGAPRAQAPIPVPPLSQREQDPALASRICSPTSLAMVLEYAGIQVEPEEVAARAYDASYDLFGNWPRSIQTAYSFGVPGYVTRYASWKPIAAHLRAGHPVVLSIAFGEGELDGAPLASTRGHLVVVCGFDEAGNVVVNDPAGETAGTVRRTYLRDQLTRAWQVHGGTAYVLEASPPSPPAPASSGPGSR